MLHEIKLVEYATYKRRKKSHGYMLFASNEKTLATLLWLREDSDFDTIKELILELPVRNFGTNYAYVDYNNGVVTITDILNDPVDHATDFVTTAPQLLLFIKSWETIYLQNPEYIFVALDSNKNILVEAVNSEKDLPNLPYTFKQSYLD